MQSRLMKCASLRDKKTGKIRWDEITFPKLCSPKLDGNRCYVEYGKMLSSSGAPIRNRYIRKMCSITELNGLDGEIIVGSPTAPNVRRATTSGVSSTEGEPDFVVYVFDDMTIPDYRFSKRLLHAYERFDGLINEKIRVIPHKVVNDLEQLIKCEERILAQGYEGIILRDPEAKYKFGRSTFKEQGALKIKRFVDDEAEIIGFEERLHNENPQERDEHGYAKRSSHKANMIPMNTLGSLIVKDLKTDVEFNVGTGFDDELRKLIWDSRKTYLGQLITYKHFPIGAKDKPNLPVFVSFRGKEDMSE